MNKLRILPGAAGIIALTATIGFVDGQRESEAEAERFSRDKITLVSAQPQTTIVGASPGSRPDLKPDRSAYLVEIRRGEKFSQVLVDAVTGKILLS